MRGRGWCRTRMRRARLVSNAFLYTTDTAFRAETFTERSGVFNRNG